jgi:hypothetical protein
MILSGTDLIDLLILFQFILITLALFLNQKIQRLNHCLLAIFLLLQTDCIFGSYIWRHQSFFEDHFPHAFYLTSSPLMLLGPCLFFYTRSVTRKGFQFRTRDLFHLVPAGFHFHTHYCRPVWEFNSRFLLLS